MNRASLESADPQLLAIPGDVVRKTDVKGCRWENLVSSIEEHGILSPPIVTRKNEVVVGQRCVLAAKELGLEEIEILRLSEDVPRERALALSLVENGLRETPHPDDWLGAILKLVEIYDGNMERVARTLGIGKQDMSGYLLAASLGARAADIIGMEPEKVLAMQDTFSNPIYRTASPETIYKVIQTTRKSSLPVLQSIEKTVRKKSTDPSAMVSLLIPGSLMRFLDKKAKVRRDPRISVFDQIVEALEGWAEEHGGEGDERLSVQRTSSPKNTKMEDDDHDPNSASSSVDTKRALTTPDRAYLSTYDVYADLVDIHVENESIVLRISKRNQPYLTVGELRKHFLGWQVSLTFRKIKRVWSEQAATTR